MSSNKSRRNLGNLASARAAFAAANELHERRLEEGTSANFCYRPNPEAEWDNLVNSADFGSTASLGASKPHA